MGLYVFTLLKSKPLKTDRGPVYRQKYLCRASDLDPLSEVKNKGLLQARVEQAKSTWWFDEDIYFVLPSGGEDGNEPQPGDKVYKGGACDASAWCDYDGVPGGLVGVLGKKDGRWVVRSLCERCRGDGKFYDGSECEACGGSGARKEAV
jgi:hypothetical protein